jgi:acyl-CoA synthetase (NDP forming)
MGGPVVLKIASPDIAHKTEVGGVLLNLQGDAAVAEGFRRIMASASVALPQARLDGVWSRPCARRASNSLLACAATSSGAM